MDYLKPQPVLQRMSETESMLSRVPERYLNLIKRTVAKDSTNEELEMFLYTAARYDLDPLMKEIVFFKAKGVPAMVVTRDGYLKIAMKDPNYDGLTSFVVKEGDEFEIDAENFTVKHKFGTDRGKILGAWAIASHKERKPIIAFVDFKEYVRRNHRAWDNYPSAMIQKVAEVFVLRRQFNIAGVVAREELDMNKYEHDKTDLKLESDKLKELEEKKVSVKKLKRPKTPEKSEEPEKEAKDVEEPKEEVKEATEESGMTKTEIALKRVEEAELEEEKEITEEPKEVKDLKARDFDEITSIDELKSYAEFIGKKTDKESLTRLSRECLRDAHIKDSETFLKIKEEIMNL